MNITNYLEYTLVHPCAKERDIIELCVTAKKNKYHAISINSNYVALAKELLNKTPVKISSTIGFPIGATTTAVKVYEAKTAINDGANEIEMVINIGLLKSRNYVSVLKDITAVKQAIGKIPLKVIIEISELNKNEIIKICEICLDAKVNYIKTSSGFSKNGATFSTVKILKKTVKNHIKIIAYDGIEDYETAIKHLESGADKIGFNYGIDFIHTSRSAKNSKVFKQYSKNLKETEETRTHALEKKQI